MAFLDDKIAERLGGSSFGKSTQIYKFALIKSAKAAARREHPEIPIIDMGVGEPDAAADAEVVRTLAEEAGKLENRWYADNGIPEFQQAAARYMERVYRVSGLIPEQHIVHGIGAKPILALLPLCFINPGDVLLTTTPGYPITATYTKYLGADVYQVPLWEQNAFLPDLQSIPPSILNKAKALYLNYPNNPTGAVASPEFFKDVVAFAERNGVLVIHDAAYGALTYDGCAPLSFLSAPGAMEVGMEVHSLSKAFNMTGWRMGFVCGNPKAVKAFAMVKDNTDSGQFRAIQWAAIRALEHPDITDRTVAKYSRRFTLLVDALNAVGFKAAKPKGTFYCYVGAPQGAGENPDFESATQASEYLIRHAMISTVPWDDAGKFIRFSVTFEADTVQKEIEVIGEMKKRLQNLRLRFPATV